MVTTQKKTSVCLIMMLIMGWASAVWANQDNTYAVAGAGFLYYTDDRIARTNLDFAGDFEFSIGHTFANNYAHELMIGYLHDGHKGDDIKLYSLSLAVMRMFPLSPKVDLFAGAGLFGTFYAKYYGHIFGDEKRDESVRPGINFFAGFDINLHSGFFTRIQLGYRLIRKFDIDADTLDFSGISTVVKIGYTF